MRTLPNLHPEGGNEAAVAWADLITSDAYASLYPHLNTEAAVSEAALASGRGAHQARLCARLGAKPLRVSTSPGVGVWTFCRPSAIPLLGRRPAGCVSQRLIRQAPRTADSNLPPDQLPNSHREWSITNMFSISHRRSCLNWYEHEESGYCCSSGM